MTYQIESNVPLPEEIARRNFKYFEFEESELKFKFFIYALVDPRTSECRYVGKTNRIKKRYYEHCLKKKNTKTSSWIKSLHPLLPEIIILESLNANWIEAECFWIAYMKSLGCKLTNLTTGGEGTDNLPCSEETKVKLRNHNLGKKHRPESLIKMKGRIPPNKGTSLPEERKLILSELAMGNKWWLGKKHKSETLIKMKKPKTEEHKAAIRESKLGVPQSKEHIFKRAEKNTGTKRTPEQLANLSAGQFKRWDNSENRKQSDEHIAKRVAANATKKICKEILAAWSCAL